VTRAKDLLVRSFHLLCAFGCNRYWVCDEGDDRHSALPPFLSETGLYADIAQGELAAGVVAYTPNFSLWSDGSEKQRWISLPEGRHIDTSNMDEWDFPVGTKVWKQFTLDGVRIETRLLEKRGASETDWLALSYVWNREETEATAAPLGVLDARGSTHDVPAAAECIACHGGRRSFVLGFSAVQLQHPAQAGEFTLDVLVDQERLSLSPEAQPVVPGNAAEVAALGYLHANCSHCHNQSRPAHDGARCFDPQDGLDFTLAVDRLGDTAATATYRTAVGGAVEAGRPGDSRLLELVNTRGFFRQMPPLATERVDAEAVANIRTWIEAL
jgi:hypothetical protein